MSDEPRYHFFRKQPGQPPKWWSTRTNRSGTMAEWIGDLRRTYDVQRTRDGDGKLTNEFLILNKGAE